MAVLGLPSRSSAVAIQRLTNPALAHGELSLPRELVQMMVDDDIATLRRGARG